VKKFSQAPIPSEEKKVDPREAEAQRLAEQLNSTQTNLINLSNQIISNLKILANDPLYGKQNFAIINQYRMRFEKFLEALMGVKSENLSAIAFIKIAQQVEMPPTPSEDKEFENAKRIYDQIELQLQTLEGLYSTQSRNQEQLADILDQALKANLPWAAEYQGLNKFLENALKYGWEVGLTKRKAVAYPAMELYKVNAKPKDVKKWKETVAKIESFDRAYGEQYTPAQILFHFTKDWTMFERFDFKKWYKWNYKTAKSEVPMKKNAFDSISQDRVNQFAQKRKRLLSRINLVRKALHEFINSGLIAQQDSNAIFRIISMLEFEAMKIQAPKIVAARVNRASKVLNKCGFEEGGNLLKKASQEFINDKPIVKVAEVDKDKAIDLLRKIKAEMDLLNYRKHLDELYTIMRGLEDLGRTGDAESIEKIIRDDLDGLEKLNKKLTEVYTNLSRVPLEMSAEKDPFKAAPAKEQVIEAPLEVSKPARQRPQPKQRQPVAPTPTPVPAPTIQTKGLPNV
jgi:hypothetical protein